MLLYEFDSSWADISIVKLNIRRNERSVAFASWCYERTPICFNVPSLKAFFSCCDMGETFIYDRLSISQVYKSHWFRLNCLWKTLNLVFKITFFSQSSNLTHKSHQSRYKNDLRMSYSFLFGVFWASLVVYISRSQTFWMSDLALLWKFPRS